MSASSSADRPCFPSGAAVRPEQVSAYGRLQLQRSLLGAPAPGRRTCPPPGTGPGPDFMARKEAYVEYLEIDQGLGRARAI